MSPRPSKPKSKATKPLGPRQALAAEAARLGAELFAKLHPEGPKKLSVPLEAFDAETGWLDPPPKQETPRQALRRFMLGPK